MTTAPAPDQLRLEYLPLADLRAAPRNPKGHDAAGIGASINRHGFVEPVILDGRTGRLVGGHGRVDDLAARKARGDHPPRPCARRARRRVAGTHDARLVVRQRRGR